VQMERLKALGTWLKQNGEAIYDTTPWVIAAAKSAEGDDLRFTRKGDDLYVTVLGSPKARAVTVKELANGAQGKVQPQLSGASLLGYDKPLTWATGVKITLPEKLPGDYAYVIKLAGYGGYVPGAVSLSARAEVTR
jgi:alpha-L-fucosidase